MSKFEYKNYTPMKYLFLFFSLTLFSQVTEVSTDDFTKDKIIYVTPYDYTSFSFEGGHCTGANVFMNYKLFKSSTGKINMYLIIDFSVISNVCFDKERTYVTFLFNDDTQLKLKCVSELNCSTNQAIWFNLTEDDLNTLCSHILYKARFQTTNGYIDTQFKEKKLPIVIKTLAEFKKQYLLAKAN